MPPLIMSFIPEHESERIRTLHEYAILDTPPEEEYSDIVAIAAQLCGTPVALVNFIDSDRQWFKAEKGLGLRETSRDISICAHAILQRELFVVSDATTDPRFRDHPYVTAPPHLRFYAAAPLVAPNGHALGTLCVIDQVARELTPAQGQALEALARRVVDLLELRRAVSALRKSSTVLRDSERRYRFIADTVPNIVWTARPDGSLDFVNRFGMDYFARSQKDITDWNWTQMLHPEDAQPCVDRWLHSIHTGEPLEFEFRLQRSSDRQYRWHLVRAHPLHDESGKIVSWFGSTIDIHGHKEMQAALTHSERFLRSTLDSLREHVAIVDEQGVIVDVNKAWQEFAERNPGQALIGGLRKGANYLAVCEKVARGGNAEAIEFAAAIRRVLRGEQEAFTIEYSFHSPTEKRWFLGMVTRFRGSHLQHAVISHENITDRKLAEERIRTLNLDLERKVHERTEALQKTNEQLRALTSRLHAVREEERAAISREIHDQLGQMLTALKMDQTLLAQAVASPDSPPRETVLAELQSMSQLVDATIHSVRRIATQLRPEVLDAFGLAAAIEWQAAEFQTRTGLECSVQAHREIAASREQTTALFRICQEALTNVARHAHAKRIVIGLREEASRLVLSIADDGRGIRIEEVGGTRSLGLLGMRERAHAVGGTVTIEGIPGCGTTVIVRVPADRR